MAAHLVVDSGVLMASFLPGESLGEKAQEILRHWKRQQLSLIVPTLFRYEVVAIVRKSIYQKRINSAEGSFLLNHALSYPIDYVIDESLLRRAYELATLHNRPTAYDSQYLAVAERYQCEVWTADERFYNAITSSWSQIRWLGNWTPA